MANITSAATLIRWRDDAEKANSNLSSILKDPRFKAFAETAPELDPQDAILTAKSRLSDYIQVINAALESASVTWPPEFKA